MRLWPRLLSPHPGHHAGHATAAAWPAEAPPVPELPAWQPDDLMLARARRAVRDYCPVDPRDPLPPLSWTQLAMAANELYEAARTFAALSREDAGR